MPAGHAPSRGSRVLAVDAGLLPIKRLSDAKQRLAEDLGPEQRLQVSRALVHDALLLAESVDFLTWFVVTDDPDVANEAKERGLAVVDDPGTGLNDALGAGVDRVRTEGADSVTVVPADVPLAFRGDIQDLLETGATSDVVVVPSEQDGGTNALYLSPPGVLEPSFGASSLRAHIDQAERRGLRCAILNLPRLALDLDTLEDAREIRKRSRFPSETSKVLDEILG